VKEVHSENRPHRCAHCVKTFKRGSHLKAHVREVHLTEPRKFVCEHCASKKFKRRRDLQRHLQTVHQGVPVSEMSLAPRPTATGAPAGGEASLAAARAAVAAATAVQQVPVGAASGGAKTPQNQVAAAAAAAAAVAAQ